MPAPAKKILFVLGNYHRGGAERQAAYLAKWLKAQGGYEIRFFAFGEKGPVSEELEQSGIRCETVPFNFFLIDHFRQFGWNKQSLSYYRKLRKQWLDYAACINTFAPDVLMPYTYYPNVVCGLSWKKTSARLCLWNQRDIGNDGMTGNYPEQLAVRRTPFFISNSQQGADLLHAKHAVPFSKMNVIPNGILLPEEGTTRNASDFGLDEAAFKVVMLANFHRYKDHETLIRAWQIVVKHFPGRKLQLVLAGRFGETEKQHMQLAADLGIAGQVMFLNSVADVYGLLRVCQLSAFSSRKEGNPNAVLEAMACGLAVAATAIPGCRDALGNDYPWLSEAGNPAAMAEQLVRLIEDEQLRIATGQGNRQRIEKEFSIEAMGRRYRELIDAG